MSKYRVIADEYEDALLSLNNSNKAIQETKGELLEELRNRLSLRQIARRLNRSPLFVRDLYDGSAYCDGHTYGNLVKLYESGEYDAIYQQEQESLHHK